MDKIIDGLYLGDIQGASNMMMLKRNNITHILQVAAGFKPFFPGEFNYLVINVLDMPFENLIRHFKPAIEFIKKAIKSGGTVLVHCFAGISRSASVVIAYLMKEHGLPMADALNYTRKRRPIVFPNPGFQRQLYDFERLLKSSQQNVMNDYQERKKKKALAEEQQKRDSLHKKQMMGSFDFNSEINRQRESKLYNNQDTTNKQRVQILSPQPQKTTPLAKLIVGQIDDMQNSNNNRPSTQQIPSRKEMRDKKQQGFDTQEVIRLHKLMQKQGNSQSINQQPPKASNTMQSSYARDFSLKKPMVPDNYTSMTPQQQHHNSLDRRVQSFKGMVNDQRTSSLIQQQQSDLKQVKQPISVSQQFFYHTQKTPQNALEDIYQPNKYLHQASSGQKTLQEKHQRASKLEESKPPLYHHSNNQPHRIPSAKAIHMTPTKNSTPQQYLKYDKPLINTYHHPPAAVSLFDSRKDSNHIRTTVHQQQAKKHQNVIVSSFDNRVVKRF